MSTLGSRLRTARERKGWTQTYVCRKLGISNSTLSGYERDYREPDAEMISTFAELYEVQAGWLLTGRADDSPSSSEEKPLNVAWFGGRKEVLTDEEADKLQEALEIHRMLKEKRMKEKNKK